MSVEFGIITSVVPPGGWHYQQLLSSGQTVRIIGFSFEQLIGNLVDFRLRHSDLCGGAEKSERGSIIADIRDYYCRNFRQNCAGQSSTPTVQSGGIGMTNYVSPINKAADWLVRIGNGRIEHVDAALAAQRAQVCAQCAQNVGWRTSCGPCNDNILIRTQNAKGSLATPFDRNLGVCRVFGHMNEVAVWLTNTQSTPEQQPPAHCWLVTEKNG
jgi:hypothetical protein